MSGTESKEDIEKLEDEIRASVRRISREGEEVMEEFQSLTREQQDLVAQRVVEHLDQQLKDTLNNLLIGSTATGSTAMLVSRFFEAGGETRIIVGLTAAVAAGVLAPLLAWIKKRRAENFLESNKARHDPEF
jgi:hypothetical protein